MQVFRSLNEYQAGPRPIVTMGTFDGCHVGHQEILSQVIRHAKAQGGESVLITFYPHPRLVLFPEKNTLRLLHSLDEKIEVLDRLGLDKLLIVPFTRDFSRTPPRKFIQNILYETVKAKRIVIGYDHRFGKNRQGDIHKLREYAPIYGYEVEEISAQAIDDANVSSTKIRNALLAGDIQTANSYLGYPYELRGEVVHGEKQGRKLGYPTANLSISDPLKLIPARGIYLVKTQLSGQTHYGLMNIGTKPTMGTFDLGVEVFLYDFSGDLYGNILQVQLLAYLRAEEKFQSVDELVAAMDRDRDRGRELINKYEDLS
jgi:riboflavin kinase/FMN adenylyltransferase